MEKEYQHFVIGTAGHIDHGKTALVTQLTGKDTDWLREEKERGMTIDLGFAFLGDNITIIDVPGHEKFVRNMVAGVSNIDFVLLVIAADDGVMPQTREHLDIIHLLQIPKGIVVLTKTDLVDSEWTDMVADDVKNLLKDTLLKDAPIVKVSNISGDGIDVLKSLIFENIQQVKKRMDKGLFRLPIDRVFTLKGFGTVVAGTVLSGRLSTDQAVELLPHQKTLRVRSIQMHEKKTTQVKIGDRAAINLAGIEKTAIRRGDVLAEPDFFHPSKYIDANLYLLESSPRKIKNAARVRLNIGTNEVIGRVTILDKEDIQPGESAYIQFRLEKPVVADADDRFVLRSYSPVITIGGGRILDVLPQRHKRFSPTVLERLKSLELGDPHVLVEQFFLNKAFMAHTKSAVSQGVSISINELDAILRKLIDGQQLVEFVEKGQVYYLHRKYYNDTQEKVLAILTGFHKKNASKSGVNRSDIKGLLGLPLDQISINNILLNMSDEKLIRLADGKISLIDHKPTFSKELQSGMEAAEKSILQSGFSTPNTNELSEVLNRDAASIVQIIALLQDARKIVQIEKNIYMHRDNLKKAEQLIISFFQEHESLTVGECGKFLNTSRKYSVPLLNYFDRLGLTTRQDDVRVINSEFLTNQ